jgi:hypothetical protein
MGVSWISHFIFSRLVAVWPRISKDGDKLVARSGWKSQLWNLGCAGRKLEVDPKTKILRLTLRRFWFVVTTRRIQFDWIEEVVYRYADVAPGVMSYQEADLFTVEIKLKNGEHIVLFRFFGQGDFVNYSGWPDWMFWEDFLVAKYTRGDQESVSLLFVDLLSRMIGVPVSNE